MIEQRTERSAFGVLLRKRRLAARLSQEQLAERAQISVQAVSALERGARRSPRADTLALLIRTLALEGADVAEFEATARASVAVRIRHDVVPREREGAPEYVAPAGAPIVETSFIGRDRERREIAQALATRRCVTLWGPGGVGKTRLAIESLASVSTAVDSIAFVALAPAIDEESIVRAISAAYDLDDSSVPALLKHLTGRSTGSRALLVLDNCEHVVEHVSRVVTALIANLPEVSILTTSREPLRIDGEAVVRVDTLAVPASAAAFAADAPPDAIRLFLDRARSVSAAFATTPADLASVATICRRLDGLPLALELAATRTRSMSVREIERALDERFSLLTRGNRTVDRRQQTLRDTIGWSYDLLSTTRRIVFERLALLNGTFAIEHAVAIAADASIDRWAVVDTVADLVDKALVTFAPEPGQDDRDRPYTMLESTRVYATTLPDGERADPDRDGAWRRFGGWLLVRAGETFESFFYKSQTESCGIEIAHLRGYLRWAIDDGGDLRTAALIVGTLLHWWEAFAFTSEGLRWTDRVLGRLGSEPADLRARTTALIGKTSLLRTGAFFEEAAGPAFESYACALRLPPGEPADRRILARTSFMVSESAARLGRGEEAETLIRSSMDIYTELGDEYSTMLALSQAAQIASIAGDRARARERYFTAMTFFERHGYRRHAAHARGNLAEIDYALGDVAAAIDSARLAADVILELSSSYYVANVLANLAAYLPEVGALDEAADAAARALDIARETGFRLIAGRAYQSIATVAVLRGHDAAEAAAIFGYTLPRVGTSPAYTDRRRGERLESLLRERLSSDTFDAAVRLGRELDDDEAFRRARAALA